MDTQKSTNLGEKTQEESTFFTESLDDLVGDESPEEIEQKMWEGIRCTPEQIDALLKVDAKIFPLNKNKEPVYNGSGYNWKKRRFKQEQLAEHDGPLGIHPGSLKLSVLDVDVEHPSEEALARISQIGTPVGKQESLKKGQHLIFKTASPSTYNGHWRLFNSWGEVRAEKGYVVIWQAEEWIKVLSSIADGEDVTDEFENFVTEFKCSKNSFPPHRKIDRNWGIKDELVEGDRNTRMCQLVGHYKSTCTKEDFFNLVEPLLREEWLRSHESEGGAVKEYEQILASLTTGDFGETAPSGQHGGARNNAGRRRANPDISDPLTHLATTAIASGNWTRMGGSFAHWDENGRKWTPCIKTSVISAVANRHYLEEAGLEPSASLAVSSGKVLEGYLLESLQTEHMPKKGMWPMASGQIFDQFTGNRRDVERTDYILHPLDYDIKEDIRFCPELLMGIVRQGIQDEESEDKLLDALSYMIFSPNLYHLFFHFYGKPRSGKGTITRLLQRLLGLHACKPIDIKKLLQDPERALAGAWGKQLWTMDEAERFLPFGSIKSFTGGDLLSGRNLFSEVVEFVHEGHVLGVSNPPANYHDEAFEARLQPFHFVSRPEKLDPNLGHKLDLIRGEIAGFLWNRWKEKIEKLPEWTGSKRMEESKTSWKMGEDGYRGWLNRHIDHCGEGGVIAVKDIRNMIVADLEEEGNPVDAKTKNHLSQSIKRKLQGEGYRLSEDGKRVLARIVDREKTQDEINSEALQKSLKNDDDFETMVEDASEQNAVNEHELTPEQTEENKKSVEQAEKELDEELKNLGLSENDDSGIFV